MKCYCCAGLHPQLNRRQQLQHTLQQTILFPATWIRSRFSQMHVCQGLIAAHCPVERQAWWEGQR